MIGLVVSRSETSRDRIRYALEESGFDTRLIFTTDQADYIVHTRGDRNCVVLIDAAMLSERCGSSTWSSFLAAHPDLALVLTSEKPLDDSTFELVPGEQALVADPFDDATIVRAVRRAASGGRSPTPPQPRAPAVLG